MGEETESVIQDNYTIEDILKDDTELKRVKQLEKDILTIESKKSRLTDLLIDGKIEQKDYDEKRCHKWSRGRQSD